MSKDKNTNNQFFFLFHFVASLVVLNPSAKKKHRLHLRNKKENQKNSHDHRHKKFSNYKYHKLNKAIVLMKDWVA